MSVLLFFASFALYAHTCAPHLAPYRDAGEMASLLGTLGVAHPPGYPLYTLLGRWAMELPLGNFVYRANIFSALCAAAALTVLYHTLRRWLRPVPALIAVVFFGLSNPFWDLATVSEMYALGVLWLSLLMFVTFRRREPVLFALLMALGLGVRMDMMLMIPIFLIWFGMEGARKEFTWMAAFFALGASVFLYLMVRSRTDPAIDWGNPDTLLAVFNSARRKSYSGTLDLLSLSYGTGENFLINLELYGRHLVDSFKWWGIALAFFGAVAIARSERRFGLFCLAIFALTGPVFLFLANMPPNPHAIAIVEASYLVPDLMIAIAIGFGAEYLVAILGSRHPGESRDPGIQLKKAIWAPASAGAAIACLLTFNAIAGYARASKRHNLYARDYVLNALRSTPRNAIAVFHKDVQLFSLWEAQLIEKRRPDVSLVATGLSASPWYWEMKRRWGAALSPEISVKDADGWKALRAAAPERPIVAGYDVDLDPQSSADMQPQGLLMNLSGRHPGESSHEEASAGATTFILPQICLYRGAYVYNETPDFFSTDLIGDTARAHHQQGYFFMTHNQPQMADWFFRRSEALDPTFARATSDRGYLAYLRHDIPAAYELYRRAAEKNRRTLELTARYKSLPSVVDGVKFEASAGETQLGAMAERLGRVDEARALYLHALDIQENAQAHYNLAVTYWGKDWGQVIAHMQRAVQLNPQMNEARAYLAKALATSGRK